MPWLMQWKKHYGFIYSSPSIDCQFHNLSLFSVTTKAPLPLLNLKWYPLIRNILMSTTISFVITFLKALSKQIGYLLPTWLPTSLWNLFSLCFFSNIAMLSVLFPFNSISYLHFFFSFFSLCPDGGVLAYIHPLLFQDSGHVINHTIHTYTLISCFLSSVVISFPDTEVYVLLSSTWYLHWLVSSFSASR